MNPEYFNMVDAALMEIVSLVITIHMNKILQDSRWAQQQLLNKV